MSNLIRSIREQIVDTLRTEILCSRIRPGTKLSETQLATRFGVGRGPLRAALSQLVCEGLVVSRPKTGLCVAPKPANEIRDLVIPIRLTVEVYALKSYFSALEPHDFQVWDEIVLKMDLAARTRNEEELVAADIAFHRAIVARARQPELMTIWQALVAPVRGHFCEKFTRWRHELEFVVARHRELVEAFRAADVAVAAAALEEHIA